MKLQHAFIVSAFASAFAAAALAQQSPTKPADLPDGPQPTQAAMTQPNGPTVVMDTSMGRITCQFFQKQAPHAVANFIALANGTKDWTDPATGKKVHGKRYYDNTTFHRVISGFMIQGGDPTGTGSGDPGFSFNDEFDSNLNFDVPGRLAMANSGPNTNGAQFFITEQAYPSLDQHYTLFGQCDDASVNVVKSIARVQTNSQDKPLVPVYLKKVTIVPEGQPVPPPPTAEQKQNSSFQVAGIKAVNGGESLFQNSEAPSNAVSISAGVAEGLLASHTAPIYPPAARQAGVSGTVVLTAVIGPDGAVTFLRVVSGPARLQAAAMDAVKSWRYRPYLLSGEPVTVKTQVNVVFSLDSQQ